MVVVFVDGRSRSGEPPFTAGARMILQAVLQLPA
jgi:hypothetical protein